MSGFTKASLVPGTPVDTASPGGILIDPTTEISGSPTLNEVIKGDGLGGWAIGLLPAAVNYQGTWDAATNTPTLPLGTEVASDFYIVDVAGSTSLGGVTSWAIGDWAIYNGTVFQKISRSDPVATRIGVGRNNANATNIWLRDANGIPTNVAPIRLPFPARLVAIGATGNAVQTWDAEVWSGAAVRTGGVPTNGGEDYQLSITAANGATANGLSVDFPADTEIGIFMRGTAINYPRVDLYLLRTG